MANNVIDQILALEDERCRCIVEQRFDRLGDLLSKRLIHTHTRGDVDTYDSYLGYMANVVELLELRREALQVVVLNDQVVILHGRQINRARRRGDTEEVRVEAMVTQVFAREEDGQWRMAAFQATSVGPPPPAPR
jgi:ketosteroid isomerase-like protein